MNSWIALLRGVNVGGHNKISMDTLRETCVSLKLRSPRTYIQSGNVVFGSAETDAVKLASRIESAIEKRCGFRPSVMLRNAAEMRDVAARNPFAGRKEVDPAKLAVFFLATTPQSEVGKKVMAIAVGSEEIRVDGRELYIYFPDGQGRSKLPPVLDRTLKMPATARNWNTVMKLLAMAEDPEFTG
jgi:uncharacterized protein (DUF1697 family)